LELAFLAVDDDAVTDCCASLAFIYRIENQASMNLKSSGEYCLRSRKVRFSKAPYNSRLGLYVRKITTATVQTVVRRS
jgi:hypothetical protein